MPLSLHMPPPLLVSEMSNPKDVCEAAASLLFFNVTWAKTVPSFTVLPLSDQLLLLEESWKELFILGAAQYLPPLELTPLIQTYGLVKRDPEHILNLTNEAKDFQNILSKIAQFRIDPHEFACLRAMVLFKNNLDNPTASPSSSSSSDSKVLSEVARVSAMQDSSQLMLNKYVSTAYPSQPLRFGKLLLLLPALRTVSSNAIEELFFKTTIGDIPIVTVICNMYRSPGI